MDRKPFALRISTVAVTAVAALIGTVALAADTAAIDAQVSATLDRFYALNDRSKYLADNAAAVLVFPSITKVGAGVGGEHGDGALLQGGKTVGYYSVSGASIGVTLGLSRHSEVILFQTPQARDKFLNLKTGRSVRTPVAVAKMGAGVTRYQTLWQPVLAFVLLRRPMGDASLQGAKSARSPNNRPPVRRPAAGRRRRRDAQPSGEACQLPLCKWRTTRLSSLFTRHHPAGEVQRSQRTCDPDRGRQVARARSGLAARFSRLRRRRAGFAYRWKPTPIETWFREELLTSMA
jgi:lipid-binding SYLF domain-containing protein